MSERELIVVYGKPGSGEALAETMANERRSELVSVDRLLSGIASLAITSTYENEVRTYMETRSGINPDADVVSGIVYEAVYAADGKDRIVVNGYPDSPLQAYDLHQLAQDSDRDLRFVETTTPDEIALETLQQGVLTHTPEQAALRLRYYKETIQATRITLLVSGITVPNAIDTSGSTTITRMMTERVLLEQEPYHDLAA